MAKSKLTDDQVIANLTEKRIENEKAAKTVGDPMGRCVIPRINIDQLVPYDNNPREQENPKHHEIKESIKHQGLRDKFTVTRRSPDEDKFMIRDGGNTRLQILKELYKETGEERFYWLENVEFYPWTTEIDALAGHMSENENRGNMLFIEKAHAALKFKQMFEEESGEALTNKALKEKICQAGWTIDEPALTRYFYTIDLLEGPLHNLFWERGIGHLAVKKIRLVYRRYKNLSKDQGIGLEDYHSLFGLAAADWDTESVDKDTIHELEDKLDKNVAALLDISHYTINHMASGYELGARGEDLQAYLANTKAPTTEAEKRLKPELVEEELEETTEAGDESEVSHETTDADALPPGVSHITAADNKPVADEPKQAIAAKIAPAQTPPSSTTTSTNTPAEVEPPPLEPEAAAEQVALLQAENLRLAKRIAVRLEIPSDVIDVDLGMGFLMSPLRQHREDQEVFIAYYFFQHMVSITFALAQIEIVTRKVTGLPKAEHVSIFERNSRPGDLYKPLSDLSFTNVTETFIFAEAFVLTERGSSRLGKRVDSAVTALRDECLTPMEENFYRIIELWRAMGWQLG